MRIHGKVGLTKMHNEPHHKNNLRKLLIEQFMLHELQHHTLHVGGRHMSSPIVPVALTLIDIYKCLHQGAFGVGHAIDHPERFKQRLYQEIMQNCATNRMHEPAVENISADGTMLRVNLRPLKRLFENDVAQAVTHLARVCLESIDSGNGDATRLLTSLDHFSELNKACEIAFAGHVFTFPAVTVDRFLLEIRQLMNAIGEVPVFSHSERYRRLNRPSYRVVTLGVLRQSPLAVLLEVL